MKSEDFLRLLVPTVYTTHVEIKSTYRSLALKYHPDNNNSLDAQTQFVLLKTVYDELKKTWIPKKKPPEPDTRKRMKFFRVLDGIPRDGFFVTLPYGVVVDEDVSIHIMLASSEVTLKIDKGAPLPKKYTNGKLVITVKSECESR